MDTIINRARLTTQKLIFRFSLLALSALSISCNRGFDEENQGGWQMVFKNDRHGNKEYGDKSKLMEAVRLGYPIRIGWGGYRVEHVANADFLTILNGEEVFAQIHTIIGQAPRADADSLKIRFRKENHWTKIAGTNGYSTGLTTDYFQDSIVNGGTDEYSATTWYVLYPPIDNQDIKPLPLWRKESPHWEKWNDNEASSEK